MKTARIICIAVMLICAMIGMALALVANDFSTPSIIVLYIGLAALIIFILLWGVEKWRARSAPGSSTRR